MSPGAGVAYTVRWEQRDHGSSRFYPPERALLVAARGKTHSAVSHSCSRGHRTRRHDPVRPRFLLDPLTRACGLNSSVGLARSKHTGTPILVAAPRRMPHGGMHAVPAVSAPIRGGVLAFCPVMLAVEEGD